MSTFEFRYTLRGGDIERVVLRDQIHWEYSTHCKCTGLLYRLNWEKIVLLVIVTEVVTIVVAAAFECPMYRTFYTEFSMGLDMVYDGI